jgi:hypothetical protein
MTLEESDFQKLTEVLARLVERFRGNPAVIEAILSEFRDMYRKIPIYPSIVSACLEKVVQNKRLEELGVGEEVVIRTSGGRTITGRVAETLPGEVKLGEVREVALMPISEKVSVKRSEIKEVKQINRGILAKEWPTLDFEEEQE